MESDRSQRQGNNDGKTPPNSMGVNLDYKRPSRKMSVVRVSGGPLAPTQLMKDPEQEAFMIMWQTTTQL
jgi:hypothetical protein